MTNEIKFHVPGPVVGKMRARVGTIAGKARMFTPGKTANYENLIKHAANAAMVGAGRGSLIDGPCQANILVGVQVPASWSKKKREMALQGLIAPTSKPDLDNVVKSAMDGMNGIVWTDDSRCVTLIAKKRFREAPGLWVTVIDLVAMQPVMGQIEQPEKVEA